MSFAIIVTAVLATMVLLWAMMTRIDATTTAAAASNRVYAEALDMEIAILRQNSQMRGFLITGDEAYLKQYREARAQGNRAAANLTTLLANDPAARAKVATSLDKITDWRNTWGDPLIARSRTDRMGAQAALTASSKTVTMMPVLAPLRAVRASEKDKLAVETVHQGQALQLGKIAMIAGAVLMMGIALAFSTILGRLLARPVERLTGVMRDLAQGDVAVPVPDTERRDEIGHMSRAVLVFRDTAATKKAADDEQRQVVDRVGQSLQRLAAGDLTTRIEGFPPSYGQLERDFNAAIVELETAFATISKGVSGIADGSGDIRQASDDLSQRTEQQAASLEETAAAMDEITSTVRRTAEDARRANQVVASAQDEASQSGAVVARAVEAMAGIERASAEISEIISVIDGIAFQTNLLALNAGVEAARAGDAGKGFAVVASEVRALAQRSAEAAKDVKTRINASSEQVESGVGLVTETGRALDRIIGRIGEINGLVASIAASAEHEATGLQQINTAVGEMDGVTQPNAAMVEQATAAARSLSGEAELLANAVGRFRLGDDVHPAIIGDRAAPHTPPRPSPRNVHRLPARKVAAGGGRSAAASLEDWSEF